MAPNAVVALGSKKPSATEVAAVEHRSALVVGPDAPKRYAERLVTAQLAPDVVSGVIKLAAGTSAVATLIAVPSVMVKA
jgi:hypothetical protein